MTPQPSADYAALAQQFGGTSAPAGQSTPNIDYTSLAAQFGAVSSVPGGSQTPNLPPMTNEDLKSAGRKALDWLPAVGATAAGIATGGAGFLPAMGYAALGGAAGEAVKQGTLAATGSPGAPQSFSQAAGQVIKSGLEQGAMEGAGRAIAKPVEMIGSRIFSPTKMYARELGASPSLKPEESAARVATGLREGIPTSEAGYQEASRRAQGISAEMSGQVANAPNANIPLINPSDIANRLDALSSGPWGKQALPQGDLAAIQSAKRQYLEKHGATFDPDTGAQLTQPTLMTPVETAEEKSATYTINSQKYAAAQRGGAGVGAAQDATEKALARGAKEELIKLYPELQSLGERGQEMYNLEDSLRQFIGRERNRNAIPLRTAIVGGSVLAGGMVGSAPGAIGAGTLGLALTALDAPEVRSQLAIALNKVAQSGFGQVAGKILKPSTSVPAAIRMGQAIWEASQPIPQLADGGIIRKPTTALIGEAGPEARIPLDSLSDPSSESGNTNSFLSPPTQSSPSDPNYQGVIGSEDVLPHVPHSLKEAAVMAASGLAPIAASKIVPNSNISQRVLDYMNRIRNDSNPQGIANIGDLREIMGGSKESFDSAMMKLHQSGKILMDKHDYPQGLSQAFRDANTVSDGKGNFYVVPSLRSQ